MHNQHALTVKRQDFFGGQQCHATLACEALSYQEITVAVDKIAGDAGLDQCADCGSYGGMERVGIVITNPGLKQVAEDV